MKKPEKPAHKSLDELFAKFGPPVSPSPNTIAELKNTLMFNHAMAGLLKACLANKPEPLPPVLKQHERN